MLGFGGAEMVGESNKKIQVHGNVSGICIDNSLEIYEREKWNLEKKCEEK